ncbi:MAG: hypothetical protein EXS17_08070 [Phycisphaerales bacterium]|nr:hypothetical protein [Phycisphaerales bacterium]
MHQTRESQRTLGRTQVLLIGAVDGPAFRRIDAAGSNAGWTVRVDRKASARIALGWTRGRTIDVVVIDHASVGARSSRVAWILHRVYPDARIVIVGDLPSASVVTEFFRAGVSDWIETDEWKSDAGVAARFAKAIETAVGGRVRAERLGVLENACRKLTAERRALEAKLGGAFANLAGAEESARDREGVASMQAECRTLLAQESEVEAVVELTTQYVIARVGVTNAAIFLMDQGQYRLAGYVRDDLARKSAGGLIEHLAGVWCERVVAHGECVRFGPCDPPPGRFAELAGLLPGRAVFAFGCPKMNEHHGSAVIVLFRDGQRPFSSDFEKVARAVAPAFASTLARVQRVLTRAQPQWPREAPESSD